jgi:hypothetical protein
MYYARQKLSQIKFLFIILRIKFMKRLFAILLVAVLATSMAFALEDVSPYGIAGGSKVTNNITIYTLVNTVPLSVVPNAYSLDLTTGFGTNPGEEKIVGGPGQFNQYIVFDVTSAKGYGIAISGAVNAPATGDTQLSMGVYTMRTGDAGWYNDVKPTDWPIAKSGATPLPAGFCMNHTQNATGQVQVLLNVEKIKVDAGAPVGVRTFTLNVTAEYANI